MFQMHGFCCQKNFFPYKSVVFITHFVHYIGRHSLDERFSLDLLFIQMSVPNWKIRRTIFKPLNEPQPCS